VDDKRNEHRCYACLGVVVALWGVSRVVCALSMAAEAACVAIDKALISTLFRASYPCDRRVAKRRASGFDRRQ
jgi:hypothetical protein